jgi:hypothetical protein
VTRFWLWGAQETPQWLDWTQYGFVGAVLLAVVSGKVLAPWWVHLDDQRRIAKLEAQLQAKDAEMDRVVQAKDAEIRRLGDLFIDTAKTQATAMTHSASTLDSVMEEWRRRSQ